MSLILDALNRADRERNSQQAPPSRDDSTRSNAGSPLPLRRWALELMIVAVAVGFFYQQSQPSGEPRTSSTSPSTTQNSMAHAMAGATVQPTRAAANTISIAETVILTDTAIAQPAEVATLAAVTKLGGTVTATAKSIATNTTAIDALYQPPQQSTPTAAIPQPVTAEAAIDNSLAILNSIPLLAQMPRRVQRTVPTINYSLHIYAEAGGLVVLNGKRLKTGAQLSPQLRITAILKDSLVLEFEGEQFRLAALNSWMNFN